jgi:hypothetical protein
LKACEFEKSPYQVLNYSVGLTKTSIWKLVSLWFQCSDPSNFPYFSDAIVGQVLDELGLQLGDELAGK